MPPTDLPKFDIPGTTWEGFSSNLAVRLPSILCQIDVYFEKFPASRKLADNVRFQYSLCERRIVFYLAGPQLCSTSGKFATAFADIFDRYSSDMDEVDTETANRLAGEYEQRISPAIRAAVESIADDEQFRSLISDRGYALKLKDEDCRSIPCDIFPQR